MAQTQQLYAKLMGLQQWSLHWQSGELQHNRLQDRRHSCRCQTQFWPRLHIIAGLKIGYSFWLFAEEPGMQYSRGCSVAA
jgi:hypothetical protein